LGLSAKSPHHDGDPPGGGKTVRRSGYTLTILRKESDGKWRLARDANSLTAQE
jgi:ketosteroid isomerase-like protein